MQHDIIILTRMLHVAVDLLSSTFTIRQHQTGSDGGLLAATNETKQTDSQVTKNSQQFLRVPHRQWRPSSSFTVIHFVFFILEDIPICSQTEAQQSYHFKNTAEPSELHTRSPPDLLLRTPVSFSLPPFTTHMRTQAFEHSCIQDHLINQHMKYRPLKQEVAKYSPVSYRVLNNCLQQSTSASSFSPTLPHTNVFLSRYSNNQLWWLQHKCLVPILPYGQEELSQNLLPHRTQVEMHALKESNPTHSSPFIRNISDRLHHFFWFK